MHIRINLLPQEIKERQQQIYRRRVLAVMGVLVLVLLLLLLMVCKGITKSNYYQLAQCQQQLREISPALGPLQEYDQRRRQYQRLRLIQDQTTGTPLDWQRLLTAVGIYMPPDVWLHHLSVTYVMNGLDGSAPGDHGQSKSDDTAAAESGPGTDDYYDNPLRGFTAIDSMEGLNVTPHLQPDNSVGKINMRGMAVDYIAVAELLQNIQQIPGVDNVRCRQALEQRQGEHTLVKFEVEARLLPGSKKDGL